MNRFLILFALPLLSMLTSCYSQIDDSMIDRWRVKLKLRGESISGSYYSYKEVIGFGNPHSITRHHIIYVNEDKIFEVSEDVAFNENGFYITSCNGRIYSDNIVYVQNLHKSPYIALILYSPKTGYHTLLPDYCEIAELRHDDNGIKFFYYDKKTDKPDYANPHVFTAEELGKM